MKNPLILLFFAINILLLYSNAETINEPQSDNKHSSHLPATSIDTTYNLLIFRPAYQHIDLVCGTMPSTSDSTVIFCAAASFTRRLQDTFTYDNIVGAYITNGQHHLDYQAGEHYGRFVYADRNYNFVPNSNHTVLDSTISQGGCAFTQMWVIKDGTIYKPYARKDSTQRNVYRCICERSDTLTLSLTICLSKH